MEKIFVKRHIEERLLKHLRQFPVTALCGPRQSGKTTLLKHLLAKTHRFISLDDMDIRQEAVTDPKMFMRRIDTPVVIDEIQYAPNLLSYIKLSVDEDRQPGRFVLTGSQQFLLMKGLSESLAGRVGILNLFPFHAVEAGQVQKKDDAGMFHQAVMSGYYPEPFLAEGADRGLWYENYTKTYLERDIRDIYNISSTGEFKNFMKIAASRVSQLFNITAVSAASKIPVSTVKRWISILEASGIVFMLRPYNSNFGKRFTKMPKMYFYDTGLLCSLLKQRDLAQLYEGPFLGQVFENYCVSEAVKILSCGGIEEDAWFLRTKKGLEADFLYDGPAATVTAEFKAGMSSGADAINSLKKAEDEVGDRKKKWSLFINMSNLGVPGKPGRYAAGTGSFFKFIYDLI